MKKFYLVLIGIMCFGFAKNVDAASFSISAPSSVNIDQTYTVSVVYNGSTPIGSADGSISYSNATCSISSRATGVISNALSNTVKYNLNNYEGYTNGTKIIVLNCKSSSVGTATFNTSVSNAWNVTGDSEVSVANDSKSVSVKTTTTTTTTTTKTPVKTTPTKAPVKPSKTPAKKTTTNRKTTTKRAATTNPIANESTTTTTETTTVLVTEEPKTEPANDREGNIKLDEFKVVGYELKEENDKYVLNIDSDINEIYVLASSKDETVEISGAGVVDIKAKNRIVVEVRRDGVVDKYIIKIKKKQDNSVIIIAALIIIIVGMLIYFIIDWKKNKSYLR